MRKSAIKIPGSAHFGFFIVWACLITIGVIMLEDALSLSFETSWHLLRFFLPFILLIGFGLYLWEKQREIMRQLYLLSVTDSLTGAYNHQFLYENLHRLINLNSGPIAVLFFDIDKFKSYNDKFGHTAGDSVLKVMADILKKSISGDEFIARYGGDEFVVVLCRDADAAKKFANHARNEFSRLTGLSASVGFAMRQREDNEDSIIIRADKDMYTQKGA